MFILDTNVISELRKAGDGRADRNVINWLSGVDAATLFVSAITIMELEMGIQRMERRDVVQGKHLRMWMNERVLPEFSDRILPVDTSVALRCAGLHVPNPCPERDAYIAATGLVHRMAVVTRNVADFEQTGVKIINPWNKI